MGYLLLDSSGDIIVGGGNCFDVTIGSAQSAYNYGALTQAGEGGIPVPAGSPTITNAGGTNLEISSGYVVPATGGTVTAGTVTFSDATTWDVTTVANAYSARTASEVTSVTGIAVATLSGKTCLLRAGTYAFNTAWVTAKAFTSEFKIEAHGALDDVTFTMASNTTVNLNNVTFSKIDMYWASAAATDGTNEKGIILSGGNDNVKWDGCRIRSNLKELLVSDGAAYKLTQYTYRGLITGASGSTIGAGGLTVTNSKIHNCWRLTNLTIDTGPLIFEGNECYDFGVDGIIQSGKRDSGQTTRTSISWNTFHSPLNYFTATVTVNSVDTANNRLMVGDASPLGPHGTNFTMNFTSSNNPNGYSAYQDIGGATVNIVDGVNDYIQMSQNLTTAGSGTITIKREQDHPDMYQVVAKGSNGVTNEDQYNIDVIGNRMCGIRFDTFAADNSLTLDTEVQGIFMQDINNIRQDNTTLFRSCVIAGNLVYTQDTGWGIGPHNVTNTDVEYNTVVCPSSPTPYPNIRVETHWNGGGSGNNLRGNIANIVSMIAPNTGTTTNNLEIDPATGTEYSDNFVNPGVPTSIADLTTRFAIKSGGAADTASPKQGASPHTNYATQTYTSP